MARNRLFGDRSADVISVVDAPVSRHYAHRARLAFFATVPVVGLWVSVGLSMVMPAGPAVLLGLLVGVAAGVLAAMLVRVWPVLRVLGWWAPEIAVLIVAVLVFSALSRLMSAPLVVLVFVAVASTVAAVPGLRRRWVAWVWCGVVRHRLRMCFAQFVRTSGRLAPACLPLILLAWPTPAGERVWVWLRPGLDLSDLEGKTPKLAVACWAGEVRVVRASSRYAALLRVDIARRDPLTAVVASSLPARLAGWEMPAPVSPGMPPLALDLDDVPEPSMPEPRTGRR